MNTKTNNPGVGTIVGVMLVVLLASLFLLYVLPIVQNPLTPTATPAAAEDNLNTPERSANPTTTSAK